MIIYGVEREIEVCDECEQNYLLVERRCDCGKILCNACYTWHKESIGDVQTCRAFVNKNTQWKNVFAILLTLNFLIPVISFKASVNDRHNLLQCGLLSTNRILCINSSKTRICETFQRIHYRNVRSNSKDLLINSRIRIE